MSRYETNVFDEDIEQALARFLDGAKRIAILGIGNELRTDDGLGPYIIANLQMPSPVIMIENVGSVPEAFASSIADFGAERVILIDAADMHRSPSHVEIVTRGRIGGVAISTHSMPLSLLMMYLEQETGAETVLLGIQPKSITFGEGLTPEITEVCHKVISLLRSVLEKHLEAMRLVPND